MRHRSLSSRDLRTLTFALLLLGMGMSSPVEARQVLPKKGEEQRVNVQIFGDQISPAIASDRQGNYAIAWLGPDFAFLNRVYLRLYDAAGHARTGEILVDEGSLPFERPRAPRIAMAPDGHFALLWSATSALWVRLYDAQGTPLGPRFRADQPSLFSESEGDLAMADDGRFLVTWVGASGTQAVYVRAFSATGEPLEAAKRIDAGVAGTLAPPRVIETEGGQFIVTWVRQRVPEFLRRDDQLVAVRRAALDGAFSVEIPLNAFPGGFSTAIPVARAGGGFSVVWGSTSYLLPPSFNVGPYVQARSFDESGTPLTPEKRLPFEVGFRGAPAVAADAHGNALVIASYDFITKPKGRLFGPSWSPIGDVVPIVTFEDDFQLEPAATAAGDGFVAAWSGGAFPPIFFPPVFGQDGNGFGIFSQAFSPPICASGSKILCLGEGGRFEASVDWETPDGSMGEGRAHPLTADTGAFWFFDSNNLELVTKVLDGQAINGNFWTFSGALSNVHYSLSIRDTETGGIRTYENPQGQLASHADTRPFPIPAPGSAPAALTARQAVPNSSRSWDAGSPPAGEAAALPAPLTPVPGCPPATPELLCLQFIVNFEVEVEFVDPRTGLRAKAKAHPLTAQSGAFSFFDDSNIELIVKMIDGTEINEKFWFFFGGLSDVGYTITVRNSLSGEAKTYQNPQGQLQSRADTSALSLL